MVFFILVMYQSLKFGYCDNINMYRFIMLQIITHMNCKDSTSSCTFYSNFKAYVGLFDSVQQMTHADSF